VSAVARRTRRTQAERTASTRKRLVAAVHACISKRGLAGTTASEIAERAGMTWGAVQHHFGGKDGILAAVLEDSVAQLDARLVDLHAREPLARRIASFVERAWEHFASPQHRSTFEILLHFGSRPAAANLPWQGELLVLFDAVWMRVFPDVALPRARRAALQHYTVAALSGLAALRLLEPSQPARDAELALLRDTLLREMRAA
jgi:AcrR family transcriptional regulator